MTDPLIRITRGVFSGMTGRVTSVTADDLRIRLTCQSRYVRIPRDPSWYEEVDPRPLTAAEFRQAMTRDEAAD